MTNMTGADLTARSNAFAALTTDQIKAAFVAAKMPAALKAHGNVYNQIRCGQIDAAIGTIKAGASARTIKDARNALRKALRPLVPGL
jgi:hypothetical protein